MLRELLSAPLQDCSFDHECPLPGVKKTTQLRPAWHVWNLNQTRNCGWIFLHYSVFLKERSHTVSGTWKNSICCHWSVKSHSFFCANFLHKHHKCKIYTYYVATCSRYGSSKVALPQGHMHCWCKWDSSYMLGGNQISGCGWKSILIVPAALTCLKLDNMVRSSEMFSGFPTITGVSHWKYPVACITQCTKFWERSCIMQHAWQNTNAEHYDKPNASYMQAIIIVCMHG